MILEIINHEYQYEAEKLTRIFYPNEKITVVTEKGAPENEAVLTTLFADGFVFRTVCARRKVLHIRAVRRQQAVLLLPQPGVVVERRQGLLPVFDAGIVKVVVFDPFPGEQIPGVLMGQKIGDVAL